MVFKSSSNRKYIDSSNVCNGESKKIIDMLIKAGVKSSKLVTVIVNGGRTKEPILNETKSPILETGQNRRFRK